MQAIWRPVSREQLGARLHSDDIQLKEGDRVKRIKNTCRRCGHPLVYIQDQDMVSAGAAGSVRAAHPDDTPRNASKVERTDRQLRKLRVIAEEECTRDAKSITTEQGVMIKFLAEPDRYEQIAARATDDDPLLDVAVCTIDESVYYTTNIEEARTIFKSVVTTKMLRSDFSVIVQGADAMVKHADISRQLDHEIERETTDLSSPASINTPFMKGIRVSDDQVLLATPDNFQIVDHKLRKEGAE